MNYKIGDLIYNIYFNKIFEIMEIKKHNSFGDMFLIGHDGHAVWHSAYDINKNFILLI